MILLSILLWGLLCGWLANLILGGGSRPQDWGPLMIAGFSGSLVGGLLINLITGNGLEFQFSGLLGSIVGAVVVLAALQFFTKKKA